MIGIAYAICVYCILYRSLPVLFIVSTVLANAVVSRLIPLVMVELARPHVWHTRRRGTKPRVGVQDVQALRVASMPAPQFPHDWQAVS